MHRTIGRQLDASESSFHQIPVLPSVTSQIETIGVGLRPMRSKNKLLQKLRMKRDGRGRYNLLENPNEEESTIRSMKSTMTRTSATGMSTGKANPYHWMPMLPFGTFYGTSSSASPNHEPRSNLQIRKLPVKILGSVGSKEEEFPRSSKGLIEIAIAGRSNVGKSTLLNALMYGNHHQHTTMDPTTFQSPMDRKFVRGKTPEGAKLPKGPKAMVSDLPGETKTITFYQVSSQIVSTSDPNAIRNMNTQNLSKFDPTKGKNNRTFPVSQQNTSQENGGTGELKEKVSLILIDLPGYGFAYASDDKKNEWKELMIHFLVDRGTMLKRILLLIDARHGMKKADFDFLNTLQEYLSQDRMENQMDPCHTTTSTSTTNSKSPLTNNSSSIQQGRRELPPIQIVLTKCDLAKQQDLARRVVQVHRQLSDSLHRESKHVLPIMMVSAKAGLGYNNIRGQRARGGILELQRELASMIPKSKLFTLNQSDTRHDSHTAVNKANSIRQRKYSRIVPKRVTR